MTQTEFARLAAALSAHCATWAHQTLALSSAVGGNLEVTPRTVKKFAAEVQGRIDDMLKQTDEAPR